MAGLFISQILVSNEINIPLLSKRSIFWLRNNAFLVSFTYLIILKVVFISDIIYLFSGRRKNVHTHTHTQDHKMSPPPNAPTLGCTLASGHISVQKTETCSPASRIHISFSAKSQMISRHERSCHLQNDNYKC